MDLGLEGRVYIVTGASRGLGYATAAALVADGARVIVNAREETGLQEAAVTHTFTFRADLVRAMRVGAAN